MGILDRAIDTAAGSLGIVKREMKFDTTNNQNFIDALQYPSVICQWPSPGAGNFISGGIQGGTNSRVTHILINSGIEGPAKVREKFPELVSRKNTPVPAEIYPREMVEFTYPVARVWTMDEYLNEKTQQIAFILPDYMRDHIADILHYAYRKNGMPYDTGEIGNHLFEGITNVDSMNVCSSGAAVSFALACFNICQPGLSAHGCTPGSVYNFLYPRQEFAIQKYNY